MEGECKGSLVADLGFLPLHFGISSEHNFPVDHTSPPQPLLAISSLRKCQQAIVSFAELRSPRQRLFQFYECTICC